MASRRQLEELDAQTKARLDELEDEAEQLAGRRQSVDKAAEAARAARRSRLHEAVSAAESELAKSTERLEESDAAFARARREVQRLVDLHCGTGLV